MEIDIFQIDAFTSELFKGNPACVMPLDSWLPDELLLNIAKENNVSEPFYELISAAIEGRLSVVNQLLVKGAQVNKTDDVGRTALMEASSFGRYGVVKRLLEAGAEVNFTDNQKMTALMLATLTLPSSVASINAVIF